MGHIIYLKDQEAPVKRACHPGGHYGDYCAGVLSLTHLSLNKMVSQTAFWNAFSWLKSFVIWFEFHWSLLLKVQLTISQHWFRNWLGAKQATSHYLNQCWPSSLMHICGTSGSRFNSSCWLIWKSDTHRFHLRVPGLQTSGSDLTTWKGTRIISPAMADRWHVPLLNHHHFPEKNICILLNFYPHPLPQVKGYCHHHRCHQSVSPSVYLETSNITALYTTIFCICVSYQCGNTMNLNSTRLLHSPDLHSLGLCRVDYFRQARTVETVLNLTWPSCTSCWTFGPYLDYLFGTYPDHLFGTYPDYWPSEGCLVHVFSNIFQDWYNEM